jgi:hypothetical protein
MKTQTTYPNKTRMASIILVAGFILTQTSLIAGDSANMIQPGQVAENAQHEYYANPSAQIVENAFETEYEIEDWMYTIYSDYLNAVADEEVSEPEMELEDWMYNIHNSYWLDLTEAEEAELAIENWMTTPDDWNITGNELVLGTK